MSYICTLGDTLHAFTCSHRVDVSTYIYRPIQQQKKSNFPFSTPPPPIGSPRLEQYSAKYISTFTIHLLQKRPNTPLDRK